MSATRLFSVANFASLAFTSAMIIAAVQLQARASVIRSHPDALVREVVQGFQGNRQRTLASCTERLADLRDRLTQVAVLHGRDVERHVVAVLEFTDLIIRNADRGVGIETLAPYGLGTKSLAHFRRYEIEVE